jgi:predicted flap endonuclease-1-like 5' DNA nuclease
MLGAIFWTLVGLAAAVAGLVALVWVLWRLWQRDQEVGTGVQPMEAIEIEAELPPAEVSAPSDVAVEMDEKPDDLKRIEGIGPKIAGVLSEAGISTYARLADTDPDQLRQILEDSDPRLLRIADPSTWPEQASYAATGDWEGLDEMRGELRAGRRA